MDLNKMKTDDAAGALWTNEKHVNYLNLMEASFVRKMLNEKDDSRSTLMYTSSVHHHVPLDRYLPDSFESTCDSSMSRTSKKKEKKINKSSTANDGRSNNERRTRRRSSWRPYGVTQDQVVPQIGNRQSDKDEESRNNQ